MSIKQATPRRLERVQSELAGRQIPAKASGPLPKTEADRQNLVERRIQEAMAAGAFDHLPGKGKPLNLNRNPYLDSGRELAFNLLQNNGFAPEWIERDKEIRRELAEARRSLRLAWQNRRDNPAGEPAWRAAVARFEARLRRLNRKIDDFNLIVPVVSCQRGRLQPAAELRRVQKDSG